MPLEFFDFSNFPHNNRKADISGKQVIYMSNNGTKVIRQSLFKQADKVIVVAFTNISKVANWLKLGLIKRLI